MKKHGILLIVCIFLILASCTKNTVGPSLEDILSANPKLQVVLGKYQDDSVYGCCFSYRKPAFSL